MLAEPKRRTVWSLNPRGKYWSEDKTKLGQRLLESMGWKEGLGLGRHEDGVKEHITVASNADNKGLGYKSSAEDVWIDTNNDYETLLANLALYHKNGSNRVDKVSDLEETSKRVRNRVHYNKLIKAKNLSQCSEKDLISIFPKKRENSDNQHKNCMETDLSESPIQENECRNQFESNTDINQYFKSKIDKMKLKSQLLDKQKHSDEVYAQEVDKYEDINGDNLLSNDHKKSKVKKHKTLENNDSSDMSTELTESNDYKRNKSKNKRKITENLEKKTENNNEMNEEITVKANKTKKNKKSKKLKTESNDNPNESIGESQSSDTSSETKEVVEKPSQSPKGRSKKSHKKTEKNIEKYNIRLPKGYHKHTVSVNDTIKNYKKICAAIASDKALSSTNLMSLKGYGYTVCPSD